MKIIDKSGRVAFANIKIGCAFKYDGKHYLKTDSCDSGEDAVNLSTGITCIFNDNAEVKKLDAEIIIK